MAILKGRVEAGGGPFLDVVVSRPRGRSFFRVARGPERRVRLLVDTGASRTSIRADVLADLGLESLRDVRVSTPAGQDVPARRYQVRLTLPGGHVLGRCAVRDLPAGSRGVDGLLGRDVLATALLVADGPAGTWTMAF